MVKLVDTWDLKSLGGKPLYRFKSDCRYIKQLNSTVKGRESSGMSFVKPPTAIKLLVFYYYFIPVSPS